MKVSIKINKIVIINNVTFTVKSCKMQSIKIKIVVKK